MGRQQIQQTKVLALVLLAGLAVAFFGSSQGLFSQLPQAADNAQYTCERVSPNEIRVYVDGFSASSMQWAAGPKNIGIGTIIGSNGFSFSELNGIPSGFYSFTIVSGLTQKTATIVCP